MPCKRRMALLRSSSTSRDCSLLNRLTRALPKLRGTMQRHRRRARQRQLRAAKEIHYKPRTLKSNSRCFPAREDPTKRSQSLTHRTQPQVDQANTQPRRRRLAQRPQRVSSRRPWHSPRSRCSTSTIRSRTQSSTRSRTSSRRSSPRKRTG